MIIALFSWWYGQHDTQDRHTSSFSFVLLRIISTDVTTVASLIYIVDAETQQDEK
jgi:hypothetical protein